MKKYLAIPAMLTLALSLSSCAYFSNSDDVKSRVDETLTKIDAQLKEGDLQHDAKISLEDWKVKLQDYQQKLKDAQAEELKHAESYIDPFLDNVNDSIERFKQDTKK